MKKSKEDRISLWLGMHGDSSGDKKNWNPILAMVCDVGMGTGVIDVGGLPWRNKL
jgi:hypothetical protein